MKWQLGMITIAALLAAGTVASAAEVTIEPSEHGAVVKIDGQLFTEYWRDFNGTPILWPIIGPTGKPLTRSYPMGKGTGEREDHPHHRSLWFTHGDVNGLSFWHRETIRHREFVAMQSGPQGLLVTKNDWIAPDGTRVCEDERQLAFGTDGDTRWIDFAVTIKATDQDVRFGDTKEGTFGVRVAASIKVDARLGGRIVNAEGLTDQEAWGKRSAWVDYFGPVDDQIVGIAIMNHPNSFRFPTYWHVRTYGLFAANPFGWHDFTGSAQQDGSYTIPKGQSIKLSYRVLLHRGDQQQARIAEHFARYTEQDR